MPDFDPTAAADASATLPTGSNPFIASAPAPYELRLHALGDKDARMQYPVSLLSAAMEGAWLDVRVKFAMQLLTSPSFATSVGLEMPTASAHHALELADALFRQAAERGWVAKLPLDPAPAPEDMAHVQRNAHAQVHAQMHAQELAQAAAQRVQAITGSAGSALGGVFGRAQ